MKYKNPYMKKIKNSSIMVISCGFCKEDLVLYQKVSKGGLLNLYIDRIVESELDLKDLPKALVCPNCRKSLGIKTGGKKGRKLAYKMLRSQFNTRWD